MRNGIQYKYQITYVIFSLNKSSSSFEEISNFYTLKLNLNLNKIIYLSE